MRRIPFSGLFLAACLGIGSAEACCIQPAYSGVGFVLSATIAVASKRTVFVLTTACLFFCFWQSFQKTSDQGYQLEERPQLSSRIHRFALEAENDAKSFRWGNRIKERFFAKITAVDGYSMDFRVQAEVSGPAVQYGDCCQVMGRLAAPERALNPGEFDERSYLQHLRVYLVLSSAPGNEITVVSHGWGNPIFKVALNCRHAIECIPTLSLDTDRPIKALIEGITFGDRSEFDPDLIDLLQDTGTLHLFVIDGLKVTLLAGISWIAARCCCLPRRWIAGTVVPLLLLYCAATGLSAAGLRATLMALFVLLGVSLERPVLQLNAMSASGLILLLYNPEELFQLGFQLSFTIVAFIVIGARPLTSMLAHPFQPDTWIPSQLISPGRRFRQRLIHRSAELFAVCTICWIASLPFSIFCFHRISFTNVVANFLAVPVGSWILFTALLSILISPIASWASIYLNNTNWLLAHLFLLIVNGSASCPGQAMNVASWPWLSETKIVVLASGRSETVYFRRGAASGLINPGSPSKYRRITEPFLRNEGVNELSFLNWSRPDQDHSGAAAEIAKHFNIASRSLQTGLIAPVLDCELGSFDVLLLNTSRQQIEKLPSQTVDVIVVPSARQCPYPELIRRFHPQAILYLQGKRSGNEPPDQSSVPIWFLGDKGAVTLALSDETLELRSYLGDRFTLRSRSR